MRSQRFFSLAKRVKINLATADWDGFPGVKEQPQPIIVPGFDFGESGYLTRVQMAEPYRRVKPVDVIMGMFATAASSIRSKVRRMALMGGLMWLGVNIMERSLR